MAATFLPMVNQMGTGALAAIGSAVPAGKVHRCDLRAANVSPTSADSDCDVYVNDTGTPANSGYRAKTYPVPYKQPGSAPDLEFGLILTAGQQLKVRAADTTSVAFSLQRVEDDA